MEQQVPKPPPERSDRGKGEPPLLRAAFGAVTGAVIGIMIEPIAKLLPENRIIKEFFNSLPVEIIRSFLPVLFGILAARVKRWDHLLHRHLFWGAPLASFLLSIALWLNAGAPPNVHAGLPLGVTFVVATLFLYFCGATVNQGLQQISEAQKDEYAKEREEDASDIVQQAINEGDPALAAGIFGLNVAGEIGGAIAKGCGYILLLFIHVVAIGSIGFVDAFKLYSLPIGWSIAVGIILALAATALIIMSSNFGELHSDTVPLSEKYRGIFRER